MMSNDASVNNDSSNANDIEDDDENEILCSACGFSSECVPEGMLTCPSNCSDALYCSVECRDWAWTGGHKNSCAVANKSASSILSTNDEALKTHNSSSTSIRNDSGKLGESFSDGSVSVASSIEVNNLFDKRPSPFFSKNKFGHFAQSSSKSSVASSPKQLPLTTKSVGGESASSGKQNGPSNVVKRGPNVSKTLGNHFNGNAPNQNTNKQLFVVSTDYDEDSDEGDNNTSANENKKGETGSASDFDYMEDQSVGLSVLEVESVANLTAIVEESSNLMSVPVIEASWRRNRPEQNPNPGRLNYLISKPSQSQLDMEDSEIIGSDSVADMITMQHQQRNEMILQQQDDLVYGVRSYSNSESISSLIGNHNSVVIHSMGSVFHETSDEEDFSYSQASADSSHEENKQREVLQQPEVVESSNSSDSADPDYITNNSGILGGRPSMPIQRGPSLRGFRDAYNECDTASLHSRSVARSLSSSEDSMSSHCDAAADLPERMHRSSSSLKDFREIYNADLKKSLLREPSTDSLGCSASFDYTSDKTMSPIKVNNDSKLSHQLELISIKSERSLQQTQEEVRNEHSPTRSEGTTSLQMARIRNESMKHSLNSALRVYEEMYGEDAAKDVFYQLTSTVDSNVHKQTISKGEQMFEWKRSEPAKQENHPVRLDNVSNLTSTSIPKYMQYRTSLSSTNLNNEVGASTKPDQFSQQIESGGIDPIQAEAANTMTSKSLPKYLQYRSSLSSTKVNDEVVQSAEPGKNAASADIDAIQADTTKDIITKSVPKYLQYRTSLSSTECKDLDVFTTKADLPKDETESCDVVNNISTNTLPSKSIPKYMEYRTLLSSRDLNSGDKMKTDAPREMSETTAIPLAQLETENYLTSKPVPEYLKVENRAGIDWNDGDATTTKPDSINESESAHTQISAAVPIGLSGTAGYLQYRDKLRKEASALSNSASISDNVVMGVDALPKLEADTESTIKSDDQMSVNETKSSSNLSCTVNSSSDVGYLPLESLSNQSITEVGILEISSLSSKSQVQNQFSQRYLQYRKSMIKPMISGAVNGLPMNNEKSVKSAKISPQEPTKTSTIPIDSLFIDTIKATEGLENDKLVTATPTDASKSVSDQRPRYLSYRLSLASMDTTDCNIEATKIQKTTHDKKQSTSATSAENVHVCATDTSLFQQQTTTSKELSTNLPTNINFEAGEIANQELSKKNIDVPSDIHLECGQITEQELINTATKKSPSVNSAVLNPDAFRFTFKQKYKQYRSSLQSLLDSENKEYVDRLDGETKYCQTAELTPIDIKSSPTINDMQQVIRHGASGEIINANKSVGTVGSNTYQVVDLDESTVSSKNPDEHDPVCCKLDETKSYYGLDALDYCGVSCSGATIDSEAFLKMWNEMEADRNSLCEERDLFESNSKAVPKAAIVQKKSNTTEMPLLYTTTEITHQKHVNNGIPDVTMDIETGLLSQNFDEKLFEEEMKKRAKDFHKKQRFGWCIIVFVALALPLGIGLGIALGRSNPVFPSTSGHIVHSTAVPTESPVIVPAKTVEKPVATTSPPLATPISTPMPSPERKLPPTSYPSVKPVATTVPQSLSIPATRSPIIQNSLIPTQALSRSKDELLQLIERVSFDDGTEIQSAGSPQSLAFEWLVSDQTNTSSVYSNERIIQRYALATLYYSTDGANWLDNNDWLSRENECTWHTIVSIENCDSYGMYKSVDLSANDLTGVIPNEMALLSRLETFKVSGGPSRYIGGIIPPALGTLTRLKVLDFQENVFFGTIPSELGKLDMLEMLDLSMNRFSQSIPTHVGQLTMLKRLNLAGNNLTGEIPSTLMDLTQLERLSLGNNDLSGQIHLGTGLSMLTELNLENNRFSSIGTEIGLLQGVEEMTIYDNALIGALPPQLTRMSALIRLDLHGNKLTGSLPTDIGSLSSLTNLDLSSNQFSNKIPSSIGSLTNLLKLNLQRNLLEGPIPAELGQLSSTFVIRINENNISGTVPDEVCNNFGLNPLFYLDCLPRSDGTAEVTCPPGTCCSFCCSDEGGCECRYRGTSFEFLCNLH